ncbi:hypothetical protein CHUAL_013200 [Chamberlinius hualienensis]
MFRGTSNFDKLLDKATSHLLLEPDWATTILLCDAIRQGDVQSKYAVAALKKKLYAQNPHVVLYALQVFESLIKNCGTPVHQEIANKQFMEEWKEIVKVSSNESVKNKLLELLQTWAYAFRNEPNYRVLQDTVNLMKVEGYGFPELKETDAMFAADQAPKWMDGECCHRCRAVFGVVQRKHHCRNCGQVFCGKCTSKNVSIPRFGFEKEVRVCEACYEKLSKPTSSKGEESELPQEYLQSSLAQQPQLPPSKTEQELQEEEDLQLAIALSKSDAENKVKEKLRATTAILSNSSHPEPVVSSAPTMENSSFDSDPELARYLNRNYWEQRQQTDTKRVTDFSKDYDSVSAGPVPSAPISSIGSNMNVAPLTQKMNELRTQNGEGDDLDDFMNSLRSSLEIFNNRMKSNASRGRSIAVDSTIQSFFMNLTVIHSQLLKFIQDQEDKRAYYETLQDKLSQAKDARAALDALREDHHEKLRREAEEAERIRQIQMAHKLEIMRKKKQEYLQYQRQLAVQKMQEQEREMLHKQHLMRQGPSMQGSPVAAGYPTPPNSVQHQPQSYIPPQGPTAVQGHQPAFVPPPTQLSQGPEGIGVHPQYPPQFPGAFASGRPPFPPATDFQNYNAMNMPNNLPPMTRTPYPQPQIGIPVGMHGQQQMPHMPVVNASGGPMPNITTSTTPVVHMQQGAGHPAEAELISFD